MRHRPSGVEWVAIALTVALPLVYGHHWLGIDGDPGRHIRVGETILERGLFYHDPFSFTRPGAAFVPYEWLSEVLAALSVRAAGLPGLLVLTGTVLALTYAVVARTLLRRGVSAVGTAVTLLFAMAIGSIHWHARPHVYTMLGAAVLIALVDRAAAADGAGGTRGSRAAAWSVAWPTVLLFAAWANLHGGFLYGLCVLAAVVVGDRLEMLAAPGADRGQWRRVLERHAVMLGAAAAGTLLTPSGPRLIAHTVGYLRDTYLINITGEYSSPDFHSLQFALVVIVLVVLALALLPRRPRFPVLALVVLNLAFSLSAVRNLPLFAIVVLPLIAAELERAWRGQVAGVPGVAGRALRMALRPGRPGAARLGPAWPLIAAAAMLLLARRAERAAPPDGRYAAGKVLFPTTFSPTEFPVRAVREARRAGLTGRLFSEFHWGGFLLYAWPEQRVFIDGQTDFYGDSLTREFLAMRDLKPGWRARFSAWRIGVAVVPTRSPIADALAHEPGWRLVHCDTTAAVLVRDSMRGPALDLRASVPDRCATVADELARAPVATAGALPWPPDTPGDTPASGTPASGTPASGTPPSDILGPSSGR